MVNEKTALKFFKSIDEALTTASPGGIRSTKSRE